MKPVLKLQLLLISFFIGIGVGRGQVNLVPNPSFEIVTSCDSLFFMSPCNNGTPPWDCPAGGGSVDLYNSCFPSNWGNCVPLNVAGYQYAHGGIGYIGFVTYESYSINYREYVQVRLDSTLKLNRKYCVNFYVSLADSVAYAANSLGMYISDSTINQQTSFFTLNPQILSSTLIADSANWSLISGEYIAHGGEQYIIIGNFHSDAFTSHLIYNSSGLVHYPVAYYYIDDVSVIDCTNQAVPQLSTNNNLQISPNPATSTITIETKNTILKNIHIYNVLGYEMLNQVQHDGSVTINVSSFSKGIYIIEAATEKGIVRKKLMKE